MLVKIRSYFLFIHNQAMEYKIKLIQYIGDENEAIIVAIYFHATI